MLNVGNEVKSLSFLIESDISASVKADINPDSLKKAVALYNQAVKRLKSKSDDIAAIELKKALAVYPDFLEAKILLALSYIIGRQMEQAEDVLKTITEHDDILAKAHRYLYYIDQQKDKKTKKAGTNKKTEPHVPYKLKMPFNGPNKSVLKLSIGFLIGALLAYLFSYSAIADLSNERAAQTASWDKQKTDYETTIAEYRSNLTTAEKDIEMLEQDIEDKTHKLEYLSGVKKLLEIEELSGHREKEQAADMLLALENIDFQGVEQQKYIGLYNRIVPKFAVELYSTGYSQYARRQYDQAVARFDKSLKYAPKGEKASAALYFMGKSYQAKDDASNAAKYYNRLVNEFPDDAYAQYAKHRLQEVEDH
ncbi:MAG: tetratricopeptide repeat protein [Firmicutes bacterium]|nr:tetratricopeptide repeat protein [Bacillota bacterium]